MLREQSKATRRQCQDQPTHYTQIRRIQTRSVSEQRGNACGGKGMVPAIANVEERHLWYVELGEGGFQSAGVCVEEVELEKAPPEAAASPAVEDAGAGGGAGASETGEDHEEQVVVEAADAVHTISIGGLVVASASSARRRRRAEAAARPQLHLELDDCSASFQGCVI
ncbi:hypothetical protein PR202_gb21688 [Eleusine coracana subsp. coracana]|uniref:Uncharacterized protein n=1 Tax=Eleusine coracana subsp. coracana TaxID=191504 RepID=A0AAV5FDS4_ELECO|nr:hypothetical protein PR202_gb21688 [Eleusine coracana subsp. coracana]